MKKLLLIFVNALRVRSIQYTITVSFTLITVLVMLFVGIVLYNKFSQTAEENANLNNQQIVEQVKFNLEYYLEGMADIFEQVDGKIRKSQGIPSSSLMEQLDTILDTRQDIVSMALFTASGELITGLPAMEMRRNTNLTEQSWFRSAMDNPNHLSFSPPHIQNLYKGQYKWVVSMSKGIVIDRDGQKMNAVLLVDVNFRTIDDLCRRVNLGKKGYVYIIDESAGSIVYHPQQQLIYAGLKYENVEQALKFTFGSYVDETGGERRLIVVKTVNNIGWKIIGVSYLDEIVTTKKETSVFIFWLLVLAMAFFLLISVFISAKITQPIKRLKKSMEKVERGDFDTYIHIKGADEVEQLSRRFNIMVSRIRQLMDQIILEQEAKRKYELEVLQSQINPHFLYNTLNSVVRMVGIGKNEEVITTITSLSKLFRISLSRGKNIITVQEELEHVRNYLIIQKMRYKDKFEFEIEAEDRVLACKTVKLILQPLVENSIHHGIEYMADKGLIRITARVVDGKVLFQVIDNGVGMSEQTLEALLRGQAKSDKGSGVGVKNVQERIRLYFGEGYGLQMESQLEAGTTVNVWIPLIGDGGEEGAAK